MSPKKDSKPRPASATHAHARPPEKPKPSHKTQAVPAQRSFEPKPPSASSSFGRRNHRKSVLVPSQGMEGQILTDDDTALLVKVDRRDSNHRVNPVTNNRWGSQTTTTDTTTQPDDEEGDAGAPHRGGVTRFVGASAEDDDNLSDFGSLYHHGGKTAAATYSNGVDQITTNWDSLHLYRFNPDFNANEIQDVSSSLLLSSFASLAISFLIFDPFCLIPTVDEDQSVLSERIAKRRVSKDTTESHLCHDNQSRDYK
jgi:hypothetical protein